MAAKRYHIGRSGKAAGKIVPCRALISCSYGEHFSTRQEGDAYLAKQAQEEHGAFGSLSKRREGSPPGEPPAERAAGIPGERLDDPPVEEVIRDTYDTLERWEKPAHDPSMKEVLRAYSEEPSPALCQDCGAAFKHWELGELQRGTFVVCTTCHPEYNPYDEEQRHAAWDTYEEETASLEEVEVALRGDFLDIAEDPSRVKDRHWTHMTTVGEDWFEQVKAEGVPVHLGPPEAGVERVLTDGHWHYRAGDEEGENEEVYVFEVAIDPEARVHPEVQGDLETASFFDARQGEGGVEEDVVVYENRWEAFGTLSLEAKPERLRVVSMKKVKTKDLWTIKTPYNLHPSKPQWQVK